MKFSSKSLIGAAALSMFACVKQVSAEFYSTPWKCRGDFYWYDWSSNVTPPPVKAHYSVEVTCPANAPYSACKVVSQHVSGNAYSIVAKCSGYGAQSSVMTNQYTEQDRTTSWAGC